MANVSIIIPVLNEASCLGRTLRYLRILEPACAEVLVVDGGSSDDTAAIARAGGATVIQSVQRGRAAQMNAGAEWASGDILCFLHGDTLLPDDAIAVIETTLANPQTACGGFISVMAGAQTTRWGITLHNSLKTHYAPLLFRPHLYCLKGLRLLFGDQVMFCRKTDFWACGGFETTLPIMEEADLCLKLCRRGRIRQVNRVVQSSDRRVVQWGPIKANFIYLAIGFLWGIGMPAAALKQFYADVR
ncbi:Putative mycofactocin biosynthesis glycosyltransferase MftF [Halomicronema hongdechloris C2206]|uniref:4,4'-diaponeurosporenoate glycosyltransferase n=1 Tax=Halomicronema hongdechloris C2206 TaxID=1641165 RepID=A0A1Z3HH22_9CYAN|nr:TIGR04283 family arsenosugar biosynthesis glycosyltransferase [Halomicronema hongdechloris]ASC69548.1 Putative mycofactocin biosynthesis glycosyltransferase MftF [Halomicronema hongdechloris C2206]